MVKSDNLTKALIFNNQARLLIVSTATTAETARKAQGLWPVAAISLGKLLTGTLLMTGLEKELSSISIRLDGGGPIGTMITSATNAEVRGYVENPEIHFTNNHDNSLNTKFAVGSDGNITVVKETVEKKHFTSTTALKSGEIADDLAFYFSQSDQIPTSIILSVVVSETNEVTHSGGILIQLLPFCSETTISVIEERIKELPSLSKLLKEDLSHEEIIKLIAFDDYQILDNYPVRFYCPCSLERFIKSLKTLPRKELRLMIQDKKDIETICHFCHAKHIIKLEEIKKIYFRR